MRLVHKITALVLSVVISGCASSTLIQTNVPGAKVYLDGEFVGTTPYAMTNTKVAWSTTSVRIEAPGYAPFLGTIRRDGAFNVGACIGGVFLLVPFLWIMDYKGSHNFELQPVAAPMTPYPAAPAPAPYPYPAPAPYPVPQ